MIGDVLTSSILFEALRKEFPKAELHYLIYKHTFPVVENDPHIDKFLLFNPEKDRKLKGFAGLLKQISHHEYDVIIDVYSKINTAFLNMFSGAETRISYHKWYTSGAYTKTFQPKKSLKTNAGYAIENRLYLLNGISSAFPVELKPKIYLTSEEKSSAEQLLKNSGISFHRPLFMCGILGSSASKTYPLPYMAKILDFIVEKTDSQLLLNYIPKQLNEVQKLLTVCQPKTRKHIYFDVFGKSLREFMAITSYCDALIGNEGGAVNMAKALDIPTFSIFSPQVKKENWSIYEDGKKNVSVHLRDFHPEVFKDLSKKEIQKKASTFYGLLKPNLIFAKLEYFLKEVN